MKTLKSPIAEKPKISEPENSTSAREKPEKTRERYYLVISSSIPVDTLRTYMAQISALASNGTIVIPVLRGFVQGMKRIRPTLDFYLKIALKDPGAGFSRENLRPIPLYINPLVTKGSEKTFPHEEGIATKHHEVLNPENSEDLERLEFLKNYAEAHGWKNATEFLDNVIKNRTPVELKWTGNETEIASLWAKQGAEWVNLDKGVQDTTHTIRRGYHEDKWQGVFEVGDPKKGSYSYAILGSEGIEYDPRTGWFAIKGALIRDGSGNIYQATLSGKGKLEKDRFGNVVGVRVRNLEDLAVENFKREHAPKVPEFDLTPGKAVVLAKDPEKLYQELERFKDNPLLRQAFVTEFSEKLAKGIENQYGKFTWDEKVQHDLMKRLEKFGGFSISGDIRARLGSILGLGGGGGGGRSESAGAGLGGELGMTYRSIDQNAKVEAAKNAYALMATAVRERLNEGYRLANEKGNDDFIFMAALKVNSMVTELDKASREAIDERKKMEKEAGWTDLGVPKTELLTGEKVEMKLSPPLPSNRDMGGINPNIDMKRAMYIDPNKHMPFKAEDLNKLLDNQSGIQKDTK